jgi:hypothetical protein
MPLALRNDKLAVFRLANHPVYVVDVACFNTLVLMAQRFRLFFIAALTSSAGARAARGRFF